MKKGSKAKTKATRASAATKPFPDREARERGHRYAKIIARAWADEDFKRRLTGDPAAVFTEYQITVPAGRVIRVVTEAPAHAPKGELLFVLPDKPKGWIELESRPLSASPNDDWLDGAAKRPPKPKPKPFPCAKCWNGCC